MTMIVQKQEDEKVYVINNSEFCFSFFIARKEQWIPKDNI